MNKDNIIELCKNLNTLADSSRDLLTDDDINHLRREQSIDTQDKLEAALNELEKENRLLNIGIIGRVKAGKSSLLNALFFDGESILPKAATPMTAALTTLSYGQSFSANVEFFSEDDFAYIDALAKEFEHQLDRKKNEILKRLSGGKNTQHTEHGQANPDQQTPVEERSKLEEKADKLALKEMKENERLWLVHEQSELMKASGLSRVNFKREERIEAANPKELASKLSNYVGAGGRYMPFCRVVHIYMPLEPLRDIRIIDTPGMNDPVQSREARTLNLLKTCDVVFIVSPAGQFLSEQDQDLMGRVTGKEGVRELVLIASQVDTQLHGDEICARLNEALESIRQQLSRRASSVLSSLKTNNPEVGNTFDRLIHSTEGNLLHSSGLCHSLSRCLDQPARWDSGEKHAWDILTQHYPDYFPPAHPDTSRKYLLLLANTEAIHKKIAEVRANKDQITQQKIGALIESKQRGLRNFRNGLIDLAKKRISKIQSADVNQLDKQHKTLEKQREKLAGRADFEYQKIIDHYKIQLNKDLKKIASDIFYNTLDKTEKQKESVQEERRHEESGLFPYFARLLGTGGCKTTTNTVLKIQTSRIAHFIDILLSTVGVDLETKANESRVGLDNKLSSNMVPIIARILGNDNTDVDMIADTVSAVINRLPKEVLKLDILLPEQLKARGNLQSWEAENYMAKAQDFISNKHPSILRKIDTFMNKIEKDIPSTFSESFVEKLDQDINDLKRQIKDRGQSIDRLNRLISQAQGITC